VGGAAQGAIRQHPASSSQSVPHLDGAIKRIVWPMLGFKSFRSARITLAGVELMHMLKKGQMINDDEHGLSVAKLFYSLAASFRPPTARLCVSQINATEPEILTRGAKRL
jgi:hypothetical protein